MRYGQIRQYDIANGEGIRTSIFVTGCTHNCFNCFNEAYQDSAFGNVWTDAETEQVISFLKSPTVAGLTLLGGEPFQNVEGLLPVVQAVRSIVPNKSIWVYSGYTWEEIIACSMKRSLLELCDVLVDGRFVDELKDPMLQFRGSSNQRVIDIKKSVIGHKIVLYLE